jgi:peptide/nickel transport system permease protein
LSGLLQGDFGKSLVDATSVNEKVNNAIYWTLLLSILSLLITFSIAVPAAFYSSFNPESILCKILDKLFFLFYAIPNFWIATLLILFFASGDYLNWFPTYGLGFVQDDYTTLQIIGLRIKHLTLPLIALSYGSIAFVYKQLKNSIQQELQKDYIITAKAKGLSTSAIMWGQLFKNASFPLITMLGGIIPALFSGSFIVEYIFAIPGMGKLSIDSILSRDFSTIYILLLIATFFSMVGLLIADVLYHFADPRVQLSSENKAQK